MYIIYIPCCLYIYACGCSWLSMAKKLWRKHPMSWDFTPKTITGSAPLWYIFSHPGQDRIWELNTITKMNISSLKIHILSTSR